MNATIQQLEQISIETGKPVYIILDEIVERELKNTKP